jgi:hypothetical protein
LLLLLYHLLTWPSSQLVAKQQQQKALSNPLKNKLETPIYKMRPNSGSLPVSPPPALSVTATIILIMCAAAKTPQGKGVSTKPYGQTSCVASLPFPPPTTTETGHQERQISKH